MLDHLYFPLILAAANRNNTAAEYVIKSLVLPRYGFVNSQNSSYRCTGRCKFCRLPLYVCLWLSKVKRSKFKKNVGQNYSRNWFPYC